MLKPDDEDIAPYWAYAHVVSPEATLVFPSTAPHHKVFPLNLQMILKYMTFGEAGNCVETKPCSRRSFCLVSNIWLNKYFYIQHWIFFLILIKFSRGHLNVLWLLIKKINGKYIMLDQICLNPLNMDWDLAPGSGLKMLVSNKSD